MLRRAIVFAWLFAAFAAQAEMILNRGNLAEPGTLDPAKQTLVGEYEIMSDMFMGLVAVSPEGLPIPGAAESWSVSADGKTTTFKLRDGLVWSDGVKMTAEDFVYTFRRALDLKTASPLAELGAKIKNGAAVSAGKMPPTALGVRAPDPKTLVIELGEPSPVLLWLLTQSAFWPVPKHVIERHPTDWTKPGVLVANGPFVLSEWRPHDHIKLKKNPRFYDAANVKLDGVNYFPIDDTAAAVKRFRAGEIDINLDFPAAEVERLRQVLPKGSVITSPNVRIVYMTMNQTRAPFKDARVRRAVSLAIEREVLTGQILKLGDTPNYALTPKGLPGYSQAELDFKSWPVAQRRAEAVKLLAAAGYGPAKPLKITLDHVGNQMQKRVGVAIADMLKQVGVMAELRSGDAPVHYSRIRVNDFDIGLMAWLQVPDPEFYTYLLLSTSKDLNNGYSNPAFDAKSLEAAKVVDLPKRMALFREAEAIAMKDSAIVPLYSAVNRSLVQPYVRGWVENPYATHPTRFIWIDKK